MAATVICLTLLAVNAFQSQYTSIVKTYSLCLLLMTGGIAFLARACVQDRPGSGIFAGFLLGLAACTRLSAGFFLADVCVFRLI